MSISAPSLRLLDPEWSEVETVCRRISFLRAVGRQGEAERIQRTELVTALRKVGREEADPAAVAARARAVLDAQQKRADRAVAFAEQLSPRLREHSDAEEISRQIRARWQRRPLDPRG